MFVSPARFPRHLPTSLPAAVRGALVATVAVAAAVVPTAYPASTTTTGSVTVGSGSYATTPPPGGATPTGCASLGTNARTFVTADAPAGAVPTNEWWSSLLWKRTDCAYSETLAAHPLTFKAVGSGLGVSYADHPIVTTSTNGTAEYHFPYSPDFVLGMNRLAAPVTKVAGWSDWTVTPSWSDGTRTLRATIGHGLPFVYAKATGGDAQLSLTATPRVWSSTANVLGFTVNGHDYAAFAPSGAAWTVSGSTVRSTLAGKGFFSVAVLPTSSTTTDAQRQVLLTAYAAYAYSFVTGTKVSWRYDEATSKVTTTYAFTTQAMQGTATGTVAALYPHEWEKLSGGTPLTGTYASPRGTMKVIPGVSSFSTVMRYSGVLGELPSVGFATGSADLATLTSDVHAAASTDPLAGFPDDTYWTGKALGRAARLAQIADQIGRTSDRDVFLNAIRARLTDWFTATPGKTSRVFSYDQNWGTLIGYPASYGSDTEVNDHHFHYGYFLQAAAVLAAHDPAWARSYAAMVDLLARDVANAHRSDTRFPFLRTFDIYAGHDWASGHGSFGAGNDQESSSEALNFASALVEWGQATGDTATRDLGIYLYTTETATAADYWFDTDGTHFPTAFPKTSVGMVWGDGASYATWFSADPAMIQGINVLPVTGASLYLGRDPQYVKASYAAVPAVSAGGSGAWRDILWEYQALSDPASALAAFRSTSYTPEEGESRAHTFHWLKALSVLGQVDTRVTADTPLYAVFTNKGVRTYVAENATRVPITVTYSDGTTLKVPAGKTATSGGVSWTGGSAAGGPADPTSASGTPTAPTPAPTATPSPTASATSSPVASPVLWLRTGGSLSTQPAASASSATLSAGDGTTSDGTPRNSLAWSACGINGTVDPARSTAFSLPVDAGTAVGNGIQARVSYDPTGSGTWSRVETYAYFATDPIPGWESYASTGRLVSATGTLTDMRRGCVRLELWNAIGRAPSTVLVDAATGDGRQPTLTMPIAQS